MNTVLYFKELKRNRKNAAIWGAIVLGFTLLILSIYPSFADMGKDITQLMQNLPPEFAKAFGMDENTWSSIIGFYTTYYGIYITLLMGIFTASTGATILGKEERDGTAEFLLTRPMTRSTVATTKLWVLATLLLGLFAIQTSVAAAAMFIIADQLAWSQFAVLPLHGLFLVGFFASVGVALGAFLPVKTNFMGPVVGLIFGTYFLNAIGQAADLPAVAYLSPYHYLELTLTNGEIAFSPWACLAFFVASLLLVWIAHRRYLARDILG